MPPSLPRAPTGLQASGCSARGPRRSLSRDARRVAGPDALGGVAPTQDLLRALLLT